MPRHTIQKTKSGKVSSGRDYLTRKEIEQLIDAAKNSGRHKQRDALLITILYRHGLRTQELVQMQWEQVMFDQSRLHVTRSKNGVDRVNNATKVNGDSTRVIQDYLGHKNIQNTSRYTQLGAAKFKGIEKLF